MNNNSSTITVLCSHLCSDDCRPLEPSEWTKLADKLIAQNLQPKDLLNLSDDDMKMYFDYGEEEADRLKKLFDRGGSLAFQLDKLSSMGIRIVTRADKEYPKQLKAKLKGKCPPLFYYAGNISLLEDKTVGFVGSRSVGEEDIAFTEKTVGKINQKGYGVVSGGAKGVDSAAAAASVLNGSFCVEYICDSLARRIRSSEVIAKIQNNQLLMLSIAVPSAGFNAGMAMQRNKYIYSQSVATVAVKSDYNKGGTWSGATDALKNKYCPVFCRSCRKYTGNTELIKLGAIPIDDDWDADVDNTSTEENTQLSFFDT